MVSANKSNGFFDFEKMVVFEEIGIEFLDLTFGLELESSRVIIWPHQSRKRKGYIANIFSVFLTFSWW